MSTATLQVFILLTLISLVQSKACYLGNGDSSEEKTCARRFYPVLKIREVLPDDGKIDNSLFLKGNVLKRYSGADEDMDTEFQDEEALINLKNKARPSACEARPQGTDGKKMVFKGRVPLDLSALLKDTVNGGTGVKFDTTGKTLVYRGVVPIKIKNLKNAL